MSKLRKSAQGQQCLIRIPGVCNGNPETTVLAHIRRGGLGGMGMKPPDVCGVLACSDCHDAIDRRSNMGAYTPAEIDGYILEGHLRTLVWWMQNGYLAVRA